MLKAPKFWYQKKIGFFAIILMPLTLFWIIGTLLRKSFTNVNKAPIPVIAVGSAIIGGSEKLLQCSIFVNNLLKRDITLI